MFKIMPLYYLIIFDLGGNKKKELVKKYSEGNSKNTDMRES